MRLYYFHTYFLSFILWLGHSNLYGQEKHLPSQQYEGITESAYNQLAKSSYGIYFGYINTNFNNPKFGKKYADGTIKSALLNTTGGVTITSTFPVVFKIGYFYSRKKIDRKLDPSWAFGDSVQLSHTGLDIGMNIYLMPSGKYFSPYVGLGFQTSSLRVKPKSEFEEGFKGLTSSLGINTFIYNAGTQINLSSNFYCYGEWKQTLFPQGNKIFQTKYPYHQISAGIGILILN